MNFGVISQLNSARINGDQFHSVNRGLLDSRSDDRVPVSCVSSNQDCRVGRLNVIEGTGRARVAKAAPQSKRGR